MSEKILIAEDDEAIRELLILHLIKEGYEVFSAKDGIEAFEMFKSSDFDLLILDVMMPRLDGYNLLVKIREISELPVIFLTAKGEEEDKVLGLGLGADDYVVKPFSIIEIISRVKAQLRRYLKYSAQDKNTSIQNGSLLIDFDKYECQKNSEIINLNPMQFKLLALFMQNTNRIYTKKQLYEMVWESEYCYDNNTIMVHISQLRDKIEDNPKKPVFIKTIKGLGYKMVKMNEI